MSNGNVHGSPSNPPHSIVAHPTLEVWGGVEATINRVGDRYFNQIERSGHVHRIEDLDLFASLGIRALRYPVLWEHVAPDGLERADWTWTDSRLERLRRLGIRPIAGLLHHGSGPKETDLLDRSFPERFAEYALAVARRYPWLLDYTPVNEPLTTARFSALYGHWYPHQRTDQSFARAILNQCKATILAMQAIRSVQPHARLIQTEDISMTHSTEHMAYQADFENERRWLSLDLLSGQLGPDNPMWSWLEYVGVPSADIQWFRENACTPDMLAINYYLTSERFLDERVELYPEQSPGTNGKDTYVDLAALHMLPSGIGGFRAVLSQAWERYRVPLCIGEAHLGGTVEEQLRWLNDAWTQARELLQSGVDVHAVTIWALLGSFDWVSLVTRDDNHYEPGPFDVRAHRPRPTALAKMVRDLARSGRHEHPLLTIPGWWHRPDRLRFNNGYAEAPSLRDIVSAQVSISTPQRLAIVGRDTSLRRSLIDACARRFIPAKPVDPGDLVETIKTLQSPESWGVILTETALDAEAKNLDELASLRTLAETVAQLGAERTLPLGVMSSSMVFGGSSSRPYTESSPVAPSTAAGNALAGIERITSSLHSQALIIRIGHAFGPDLDVFLSVDYADEDVISPAYLPDIANTVIDLFIDGEKGIWHLANTGCVPWSIFRKAVMGALGITSIDCPERRPPVLRPLSSERGWPMRNWEFALADLSEVHRARTGIPLPLSARDNQ